MREKQRKYEVVIIDDEPWTREAIKEVGRWEELRLKVVGEASDGEYGLELIRQLHPAIILTDVRMPRLSGIDLVEILRNERNEAQIIIISGYDEFSYIHSALKCNVTDYLLKPVKPEELNEQLKRCIRKLDEKERHKQNEELKADFFGSTFSTESMLQKDMAYHALVSGRPEVIKEKFEEIKGLLADRMQKELSKGVLIGIYYDLMSVVQNFVYASGYRWDTIFKEKDTSFVFGQHVTYEEMLKFMEEIYREAGKSILELKNVREKLDIEKVEKYVLDHYTEAISLEKAAGEFFVSKEYLSKTFKEKTGKGFSEYVTALRMKKAVELIHEYKVPIKEAGYLVGYVDLAHFYKIFKHFWGITPKEMRDKLNIDNKTDLY